MSISPGNSERAPGSTRRAYRIALPADTRDALIGDDDLRPIDDPSAQHIDQARRGHDRAYRERRGQVCEEQYQQRERTHARHHFSTYTWEFGGRARVTAGADAECSQASQPPWPLG